MSIFQAVIQGIIQGLTEFLPISSSGHLSLYQHFTKNSGEGALFFSAVLHIATLAAVFIAFRKRIWSMMCAVVLMIKGIFDGSIRKNGLTPDGRAVIMMLLSLAVLFPFYIFKDFFEGISQDNDIICEGICFIYTAALLFVSDRCSGGKKDFGSIKASDAVKVGAFQGIALLPGVSRSGSVIAGGLICGFERLAAVEYSFILGIPAILGGAFTEAAPVIKGAEIPGISPLCFAAGAAAAFITGILSIKMVRILAASDRMRVFSVYTLMIGLAAIAAGMIENACHAGVADIIKNMF